jgi:cytochrome c oxidase assembly protein Cox11
MLYFLVLTVGIALLSYSFVLFRRALASLSNGIKTIGTVIEHEKIYDSQTRRYLYKPIFQFRTATNQDVVFKYNSASTPARFDIGEEVPVIYNPEKPSEAMACTYGGVFIWTILAMSASMPFIVIGAGYFLTLPYLK